MALNNFMHPRNIYKNPPDFSKLAAIFPEFSNISKTDVTGKVTIDFKDHKSLRILTKCLLKSDFNVDIDIPEDNLVPTLPLRLNYILWVEDIMTSIERENNIQGIDIGTGACAIYPVLAAVKNKWRMIGTEVDMESYQKAQDNINKNNLNDFVKLTKTPTSSVIGYVLEKEKDHLFDFCMCNPPFYSSLQDLCESRSPARPPPKNAFTGSPQELITEGGELNFCRKLISESNIYKDRVRIFTTMLGHKYNLKELLQDLTAAGIKFTHTEFCQGRVTRWGLAWTHQDYDIYKLIGPRDKLRKKNAPATYLLPELSNCAYNITTCAEKMRSILSNLEMEHKVLTKVGNNITMQMSALKNTWSHQRRKRRLLKRIEETETKKIKLNDELSNNNKELCTNADERVNDGTESVENGSFCEVQSETNKVPILEAFIKLYKKDSSMLFEIEYLNGSAGKEGLHQVVQYIKNNWK